MKSFEIKKTDEGQTSLKYIQRLLKAAPNSFIYKMMRKKNFVVNDKKIEGNEKLKEGDIVKLYLSDDTFVAMSGANISGPSLEEYREAYARFGTPDIVYEDSHIIILNKPVDMLSQKALKDDLSANEWLIGYLLNKGEITKESLKIFVPSVCNRLDRNTGGLLLFGKSLFGTNTLNTLLRERTLDKYYLTVVKGRVLNKINVSGYLYKDEKNNKVTVSDNRINSEYSYIETEYEPLEYFEKNDVTLLKVLLVTGKPHQIRAHLSYLNHPIIGDYKYGNKNTNDLFKEKYRITSQILYCVKVSMPKLNDYPEISFVNFEIPEPDVIGKLRG